MTDDRLPLKRDWLLLPYRRVAEQSNFSSKSIGERWRILIAEARAVEAPNGERLLSIEAVPETEFAAILAYLRDRQRPDEDRDVVLHPMTIHDAATTEQSQTWNVFVGPTNWGAMPSEPEGINRALDVANEIDRPAWKQMANGTLSALTSDDRQVSFLTTCPRDPVHRFHGSYLVGYLRRAVERDELKFHCISCDEWWKAGPDEIRNISKQYLG